MSALWLLSAAGLALWAYHEALHAYFAFDDFLHLSDLVNEPFARVLFQPFAGHLYVVRNLVWAALYWTLGPDPRPYFAAMLACHVVAVGLLFELIRRVGGSAPIAAVAAATWGTSPLHAGGDCGTLNWYSVHGHVLALDFALVPLVQAAGVPRGAPPSRATSIAWAALFCASAMSFGIGLALAATSPLILWLLVPPEARTGASLGWWVAGPACAFAVYGACRYWFPASTGLIWTPDPIRFVANVAGMLGVLLQVGAESMMTGPLMGLVPPSASTIAGAAFWALVVGGLWRADGARRRAIVALLVAAGAAYGMIAVGRGSLYQLWGMRGASEARYHYGASAMLTAAVAVAVSACATRWIGTRALAAVALVWLAGVAYRLATHPIPIRTHDVARFEAARVVSTIEERAKAAPDAEVVYVENRNFASVGPLQFLIHDEFPGWAAVFTVYFPTDVVAGHEIRFVDPQAKSIAQAHPPDSRIARIVIGPDDLPASAAGLACTP